MKQNRLTTLLAAGAVSAIALTSAFAQESPTTTTTTQTEGTTAASSTSTSPVDASGIVVAYKPGLDFITVKIETSIAPIMYYYTKSTTVLGPDGKTGDWSMIKPDTAVKYTYINDGGRMVITKIALQKPSSSSEKAPATKP